MRRPLFSQSDEMRGEGGTDEHRARAISHAAQALARNPSEFTYAAKINHGLTNDSWMVRAPDAAVVVRLGNASIEALQIDRHNEERVLRFVAERGIGPRLLLSIPESSVIVTELIRGRTWNAREIRTGDNLRRVASLLNELHRLTPPPDIERIDLQQHIRSYWNTLLARGLTSHAGSTEKREKALALVAELAQDIEPCLCHNDVHHLNIVDTTLYIGADVGRLHLVDWEYASINDPYFDLASVCCYHALSDDARRDFLRAYLGHDRPRELDRLHKMCWVFNYIRDLWFAVREMR